MRKHSFNICLVLLLVFLKPVLNDEINTENKNVESTEIAHDSENRLLLFFTLDGNLVAIEEQTGRKRWNIYNKPVVQVPVDITNAIIPIYIPDPRDGSLYLLGANKEPLKKLPFTIPQLVASSPCRSSDGILYTGKKKDTWYKLDPNTGRKDKILGWDKSSPQCPVESTGSILIGVTKYDIMMVDSHSNRKWNVTYFDYTASPMTKEQQANYELVHFASTSSGRLVTMDRRSGKSLWEYDLESPVVAAYILHSEGLLTIPFTSLANHTLNHLTSERLAQEAQPHPMKLYPTLYVGDHRYGLYALPSLIDQNMVTITPSDSGPLLLGGPYAPQFCKTLPIYPVSGQNYRLPSDMYNEESITFESIPHIIYMGHYNIPKYSDTKFLIAPKQINLITDASKTAKNDKRNPSVSQGVQTDQFIDSIKLDNQTEEDAFFFFSFRNLKAWLNQQENKAFKLIMIISMGCLIAMFWYIQGQVRELHLSQNGSRTSQQSSIGKNSSITAYSEELENGSVKIGKITFDPEQLLGKGCEGTFVYKGEFDSRKVAVKRLLPDCFTFADREVTLLRESDAHPNVIRYYCMEQDRLFRYIALELCQATLSEYVQGKCDRKVIKPIEILRQATSGLEHLHSLDIVHRDIKPHNVLLSMPNNHGVVKAMISDFGLCKKLQVGKVSFSRRSGVTGTDGWIAPEMLNGNERTTCAVDLFSLGCLYYYVLSGGLHAFGDALRRQANILSGDWNLSELKGEPWEVAVERPLLAAMISSKPHERPSCSAILKHPMFWDSTKILAFFQDVSDRVEKAEQDDSVLQALEFNNLTIVREDWRSFMEDEVFNEIKKYRSYRGESVRDLLRALRNKKHHFRELGKEAQGILGEIPEAFTVYFVSKFPLLLVHTWLTMQCVSKETSFQHYYHHTFKFSYWKFYELIENNGMDYFEFNRAAVTGVAAIAAAAAVVCKEEKKSVYQRRRPSNDSVNYSPKRENVGLYRNLRPNELLNENGVSRFSNVNNQKRYKSKNKRASKKDEPVVWATNDK